MKICVTQDDIDKGKRRSFCSCPVARAIRRDFKGSIRVTERFTVEIVRGNTIARNFQLPSIAGNFICDFDDGKPVKPFFFDIQ